ncbi:MAG: L,D-transpeptidase family protein [Lachnospiraceae bacterium]|nr:L,D-transpeptidase family protein [Lachnospiraceae bacterium]
METVNNTENIEKKKLSINAKKICIVVIAILAVIYIIGAIYYHDRYLYGTKIGHDKIGGKTPAQVEKLLSDRAGNYELKMTGREKFKDSISGKDIDLKIAFSDNLKNGLEKQSSFLWFLGATGDTKNLTADVSYDEKKLTKEINKLDCFKKKNIIAPENAKVVLDDKGKFVIKEEVYGTTVDKDRLTEIVKVSMANVDDTLNLKKTNCYKDPTLLKDDKRLSNGIEQANKLSDVTVTYDFKYTTEKVDKNLIKNWIVFDKDMNASLSYKKVLNYIEDLAKKYDTYSTIRTVKDAAGNKHKIYFGSYGWKISQTKEAKKLMSVIKKGKDVKREPIYLYKAVCRKKGNIDWDDTYALVNISSQSMVFIKDGKAVVSSSVVTGDPTKGHSTPTGAYQIMYKERNTNLVGQGYSSPVSYWMPFTTNTGFHDASWRHGAFGGSIYRGNGSHGCVNMPEGNAAALYSIIEKGTPVFVY